MAAQRKRKKRTGKPLTKARIIDAAVALADESGMLSFSMRKLGQSLGVEAMSLYNHVANKDDILDAMLDHVMGQIDLPQPEQPWKEAMRTRAVSARKVCARHPWATRLMDSRKTPGEAFLKHHNAVLGALRGAGFSMALTIHAFSLMDSYIYGFVLQEQSMPIDGEQGMAQVADEFQQQMPQGVFPHMEEAAVFAMTSGYNHADEFEYGLDLILDALELRLKASTCAS